MLSLILAILGIIVGFFVLEIGFILEIVAFFIAKKQMKSKEKYSNYAYYISLIVGILQLIIWVAATAYTLITVNNIIDEGNKELDKINKKYETILEYHEKCEDKYDSYEEYNTCADIVDDCFDKYEDIDKAKQCVGNLE